MDASPHTNSNVLPFDRFWSKVNKDGPVPAHRPDLGKCWVWTASLCGPGYGKFFYLGKLWLAHQVSFILEYGALPPYPFELDHLCRTRACIRESHLEPVLHRENLLRGPRCRRTHCKYGHALEGNTYVKRVKKPGCFDTLICATCAKQTANRRHNFLKQQKAG